MMMMMMMLMMMSYAVCRTQYDRLSQQQLSFLFCYN